MKLKILHILHSLRIGGLENGIVNLINHSDDAVFNHVICCIDSSGPMAKRINKAVEIYSLGKKEGSDYLLPFKIAKTIKKIKPDIVHTRNWAAIDGVVGAKIAGVNYIVHGEHGREATDTEGKNILRKTVRRALTPWISMFVTVSAELKKWLIKDVGVPEKKVVQIINGVDTNKFSPVKDKKLFKTSLGINSESFVIGTVGRLDPVKDHETLLKAFKIFMAQKNSVNVILLVVGEGFLSSRLRKLARDLNISSKIIFTGQREDILFLYSSMDVYILPSIAEGISNTILEAMSCGLPVVATAVGGNSELVDNNITGALVTPRDHRGLAEKLLFYCGNTSVAKAHGLNARAKIESGFSVKKMKEDYERLYHAIAGC